MHVCVRRGHEQSGSPEAARSTALEDGGVLVEGGEIEIASGWQIADVDVTLIRRPAAVRRRIGQRGFLHPHWQARHYSPVCVCCCLG